MNTPAEIEAKFWKSLSSDRVAMLGLTGDAGHSQPMSAQILHDEKTRGPIWFFTSKETGLARALGDGHRAMLHFSAKDHDLFASVEGDLVVDNDRAIIDRLWNRYVAAWYEGGKEDPKLLLVRFDPEHATVWLNENHLVAGAKLLLGRDPKREYRDNVVDLRMSSN
jgi:general stress protein 26